MGVLPEATNESRRGVTWLKYPMFLLDAWAAAIGQPAFVTSTVAEITGTRARTFRQLASDHSAEFRR